MLTKKTNVRAGAFELSEDVVGRDLAEGVWDEEDCQRDIVIGASHVQAGL